MTVKPYLGRYTVAALMLVLATHEPAHAADVDRVAVLVLPGETQDEMLARNLTEVVIARIANQQKVGLADASEFRRRLELDSDKRAQSCLEDKACLGRLGVVLDVRRVVSGTVSTRDKGHLISLVLTNIASGEIESRFFQLVPGSIEALVEAIQDGTDSLFRPKAVLGHVAVETRPPGARVTIDERFAGTTPMVSAPLIVGWHQLRIEMDRRKPWSSKIEVKPGTDLQIKLNESHFDRRRAWPRYVGFGGVGGGLISLTVGGVFGTFSQQQINATTRVEVQAELEERNRFASNANALYALGGALLVSGVATLWYYSDDVFED
jgi:PEGA domain